MKSNARGAQRCGFVNNEHEDLMIKHVFATAVLLWAPIAWCQQWQIVAAPESYRSRWMAEIENVDGHKLRIWRRIQHINFQAWTEVSLSTGFKFSTTLPEIRFDDSPPRPIERPEEGTATIKPTQVSWRVWASTTADLMPEDALTPWIRSNTVSIVFSDEKNQRREITFPLTGSGDAIRRIVTGTYK